jgi:hypothetical protein
VTWRILRRILGRVSHVGWRNIMGISGRAIVELSRGCVSVRCLPGLVRSVHGRITKTCGHRSAGVRREAIHPGSGILIRGRSHVRNGDPLGNMGRNMTIRRKVGSVKLR